MDCLPSARLRPASSLITLFSSLTVLSGYARNQIGSCLPSGRCFGTTLKVKGLFLGILVVPGIMNGAARVPVAASFGRTFVPLPVANVFACPVGVHLYVGLAPAYIPSIGISIPLRR
jgi:hypothetical protein